MTKTNLCCLVYEVKKIPATPVHNSDSHHNSPGVVYSQQSAKFAILNGSLQLAEAK